jgi:hypothetical protein
MNGEVLVVDGDGDFRPDMRRIFHPKGTQ